MTLPLDLYAEVETATGARFKWDANQEPGSRLRNFSFRTKIGEGFSDASGQLARRIDQDYPDLNLVNTITFVGADGSVAYEGRMSAMPRDLSDTHSIGVTLTGWMAHAKDKKFQEIYVDRDLSVWQPPPLQRRLDMATGSISTGSFSVTSVGTSSLVLSARASWTGTITAEAHYRAPAGATAARIVFSWATNANTSTNSTFFLIAYPTPDGYSFPGAGSADQLAGAASGSLNFAPTIPLRQMLIQFGYPITVTNDGVDYEVGLTKLAVYGNHGLTLHTGEVGEPDGVYVSDVMRDIVDRFCPQLDSSGIQDTTYVVQHLAFNNRTFPYDAFLELNKYHLWHLGVWEGKRLDFKPYDLTDYDWEIRTDDPGTTFSPQGPSTEDLFNGICVTYRDILTDVTATITPDDDSSLADTSSTNPWNMHGVDHWDDISLSTPSTAASAVQLGRAALSEKNRAKTPGTITCKGYIRDRAGNDQPVWKVRAGDTISVTNFPNDSPRLIVETDYNDEDKTIRIAVDRPFQLLEAYLDRVGSALDSKGLGG